MYILKWEGKCNGQVIGDVNSLWLVYCAIRKQEVLRFRMFSIETMSEIENDGLSIPWFKGDGYLEDVITRQDEGFVSTTTIREMIGLDGSK